jgi:hypothetical protein
MTYLDGHKKVKNWDKTRCFVRQKKVIYGNGEENILGQEKVILFAGEVVHGSGEFDQIGKEKMIRWDGRSCIWVRRV